jgi:hypothetical protein
LGATWQVLAALWLRAETTLFKSGHTNLSFTEIQKATIPDEWKEWMNAKLLKTDVKHPAKSFRQVFTNYLNGLPSTVVDIGGTVVTEIWC